MLRWLLPVLVGCRTPSDTDAPLDTDAGPIASAEARAIFAIVDVRALALVAEAVDVGARRNGLGPDECGAGATTNLFALDDGGDLVPAACVIVEQAQAVPGGLVVRAMIPFDVAYEGGGVGTVTASVWALVDSASSAATVLGWAGSPNVPELQAAFALDALDEFFGATASTRLVFTDVNGRPWVYDPIDGGSQVVASEVFGTSILFYLSGNFAVWRTAAGLYQMYDVERGLRYNLGNYVPNVVALSPDVALRQFDGQSPELFRPADGTTSTCPFDPGFRVQHCFPHAPCGADTEGAVVFSDDCPGDPAGICHVSPTCDIRAIGGPLDVDQLVRPDPALIETHDPSTHSFVAVGTDWFVTRGVTSITAWPRAGGEGKPIDMGGPINLAYVAIAGNTAYYAGETPAGAPIYRSVDLDSDTAAELTRLEAADRIIALQ